MATFVDSLRRMHGSKARFCCMMSDSMEELEATALLLKLSPHKNRGPDFYILNNRERNLALYYGAVSIVEEDVMELRQRLVDAKKKVQTV